MKRIISLIVIILALFLISGCDSESYNVTFMADGNTLETILITKGKTVDKIDAPEVENKEFLYWTLNGEEFDFLTPIENDTMLIAKYKDIMCSVTYMVNGNVFDIKEVKKGDTTVSINAPTQEDKLFLYWANNGEEYDFTSSIISDIILEAVYYGPNTVTYIVSDSKVNEEVVYTGDKATQYFPSIPEGYDFLYWEYNGEEYDFNNIITSDIVLIAKLESNIKPVTIKYWHANGAILTNVLEGIKEDFEAKYEGKYIVELKSFGDYETLRDTVVSSYFKDQGPTAAQTYPDHVSLYLEGGALQTMEDYINHEEYGISAEEQSQFIEGFWNEGTIYDKEGTRYAMPFNKSTELMYYNKTIFDKYGWTVPTTWDEVVEIAKLWMETPEYASSKTTNKGKVYALGYDSEANMFITLTQQWGAKYTSFDINGKGVFNSFGVVEEDTLKSKEAMNWYLTQFKAGYMATSTGFSANYCSDAFKAGQCIILIGSSSQAINNDGSDYGFETAVSSVPQYDKENGQVIQQGTNVSLFKCKDKEEELGGWLWLKHMVSYESALKWALDTSYFPIRKDVINSTEYQEHLLNTEDIKIRAKQAGLLQQDWFFTNIVFPESSKARDYAETIVQQILYGSVSIDKAYEWAYNSVLNN